jgi:hypothetical protein
MSLAAVAVAARNLHPLDIFFDYAFGCADLAHLNLALYQDSFESRAVALRFTFAAQKRRQWSRAERNAFAFVERFLHGLLVRYLHAAVFHDVFVAASRIVAIGTLSTCDAANLYYAKYDNEK